MGQSSTREHSIAFRSLTEQFAGNFRFIFFISLLILFSTILAGITIDSVVLNRIRPERSGRSTIKALKAVDPEGKESSSAATAKMGTPPISWPANVQGPSRSLTR